MRGVPDDMYSLHFVVEHEGRVLMDYINTFLIEETVTDEMLIREFERDFFLRNDYALFLKWVTAEKRLQYLPEEYRERIKEQMVLESL